jgi:hypothetical protein
MQVCTIYWDEKEGLHHTLVSEVSESGEHKVVESHIWDNMLSATWSRQVAQKRFGYANVRFYMITEVR